MHIFLYEWTTGGGLVDQPGSVPVSLVREGAAMLNAVAADFARIVGCRVTCLRDMRVLEICVPGCDVIDVHSQDGHRAELRRAAEIADATIIIAPEFDGILLQTARRVLEYGGRLLCPAPDLIALATDKHRTAEVLAGAEIPVPHAVLLDPEDPLPADFPYPAVLKPVDGAGSTDTQLVVGPYDTPLPYAWARRLEAYCPGLPASVSFLCGPKNRVALCPCRQRLSTDGRLRYLGGALPLSNGLAVRATTLAARALANVPLAHGYVGVDLVLGNAPDGSQDFVIEINPRLTTSYVGLRAATQVNLAEAMWQVAQGQSCEISFQSPALEFDGQGNVCFV